MSVSLTKQLRAEYDLLFSQAALRPEKIALVKAVAARALSPGFQQAYRAVEAATGVPWFVVAAIHNLEASQSMSGHLHNGDPLTARTTHVPKGRPKGGTPPFSWSDSAIDALKGHGLHQWTDWSVAGLAFVFEGYNGFGYRQNHPQVKSPYLWSQTTIYSRGKYAADGKFDPNLVSGQVGAFALLIHLDQTGAIQLPRADGATTAVVAKATPVLAVAPAAAVKDGPPPYPGNYLSLDSTGPSVELMQRRLFALGCDPKGFDGDFGEDTERAVKLFQARSVGEDGEPLDIDGVVGPESWAALFGGAPVPPTEAFPAQPGSGLGVKAIETAQGQIGVREHPLGSNRGPEVDRYMNAVSAGLLGQPWCMAFVYWCFEQAADALGQANAAPKTAGVARGWTLAQDVAGARIVTADQARRNPALVVPGMVFYMDFGGGTGHTGIVVDNANGRLTTIEGNTNDGGGREGIGVFLRTSRQISQIQKGFVEFS